MTLEEKLDDIKWCYFGNPLNYNGPWYRNLIGLVKRSDCDILLPYINSLGLDLPENSAYDEEVKMLPEMMLWKLHYITDGTVSVVVEDDVIKDPVLLDKFFREQHSTIIGPACDYDGNYSDGSGDVSLRHDIFGNVVESAEYKYFSSSHIWLEDCPYNVRRCWITNEEDSERMDVTVFPSKVRGILRAIYHSDEEHPDIDEVSRYFDSETQDFDNVDQCIVFVDNLDNLAVIKAKITEKIHDSNFGEENDSSLATVDEDRGYSIIKVRNPISFTVEL